MLSLEYYQFSTSMTFFTENEYASYHIHGGILYINYKDQISIDLTAAVRIVEDRLRIQEGLSYNVICDIRGLREVDKSARDYLAIEGSTLVKSVAYIVETNVSKALSQFYLRISKPPIPSKIFTTLADAKAFVNERLEGK